MSPERVTAPRRDPLPVFAGILTFARAPMRSTEELTPGTVAVAGIAFDHTCTGRIGSRFGPRAIREASVYFGYHLQVGRAELIEPATGQIVVYDDSTKLADVGDLNIYPADLRRTVSSVSGDVAAMFQGNLVPVIMGGDVYTTGMFIRGARQVFPQVQVLVISGEPLLADEYGVWGKEFDRATLRRLIEAEIVSSADVTVVGVSGWCRAEEWRFAEKHGVRVYRAPEVSGRAACASVLQEVVTDTALPVLLCIDMSVLDGAYAAGTAMPRFSGLSDVEFLALVEEAARTNVAGMILTGVNPTVEATWTAQRLASLAMMHVITPLTERSGGVSHE